MMSILFKHSKALQAIHTRETTGWYTRTYGEIVPKLIHGNKSTPVLTNP
jgi:hypothetical protein